MPALYYLRETQQMSCVLEIPLGNPSYSNSLIGDISEEATIQFVILRVTNSARGTVVGKCGRQFNNRQFRNVDIVA